MKLQIKQRLDSDQISHRAQQHQFSVEWTTHQQIQIEQVDDYQSPASASFIRSLQDYYLTAGVESQLDRLADLNSKLVQVGHQIGDSWLGETSRIERLSTALLAEGGNQLQVEFVAQNPDFAAECWELAILPEDKFFLATRCQRFVRCFAGVATLAPLSLDLQLPPLPEHALHGLTQLPLAPSSAAELSLLNILYVTSRPAQANYPFMQTSLLQPAILSAQTADAIRHEIIAGDSLDALTARLKDRSRPVHILHFDGGLVWQDEQPWFCLNEERVSVEAFVGMMTVGSIPVLAIDARECHGVSLSFTLAHIARLAVAAGIGNVISTAFVTDPLTSSQCFQLCYQKLLSGLEFGQAVVEARKQLLAMSVTQEQSAPADLSLNWPLLVHYSHQQLSFFQPSATALSDLARPDETLKKLFGFKSLLLPPLLKMSTDRTAVDVVLALQKTGCVALYGRQGQGKSHASHLSCWYLLHARVAQYGFYFDFNQHLYHEVDMLSMIGSVLAPDSHDDVALCRQRLLQTPCCIVLDNLLDHPAHAATLFHLVLQCLGQEPDSDPEERSHHYFILTGQQAIDLPGKITPLQCTVFTALEVKSLIQQAALPSNLQSVEPTILCQQSHGNPWLVAKMLAGATLVSAEAEDTSWQPEDADHFKQAFFKRQWLSLNQHHQYLLSLLVQMPDMLLEMLSIGLDRASAQGYFAQLRLLLQPYTSMAQLLDAWSAQGFCQQFPHGRVLDQDAVHYIQQQSVVVAANVSAAAELELSEAICQGVTLLAAHIAKQPNASISNNLMMNRHHWARQLETLWRHHRYSMFFATRQALLQMMSALGLKDEMRLWTAALLQQEPQLSIGDTTEQQQISWLVLASEVVQHPDSLAESRYDEAARHWQHWFERTQPEVEQLALYQQVATFLQCYYEGRQQWQAGLAIVTEVAAVYHSHQAWTRLIGITRTMALYHARLNNLAAALQCEQAVLQQVPFAQAPEGTELQVMADMLLARMERADYAAAKSLLGSLEANPTAEKFTRLIEHVSAELSYQNGDYAEALPYFSKIWSQWQAMQQPSAALVAAKTRLQEIRAQLGAEHFSAIFARYQQQAEPDW